MRKVIILLVFLFFSALIYSQEIEISDSQEYFNFYLFVLEAKNVSQRNRIITQSIPQLIYNNVSHIKTHTLSEYEVNSMRRYLFDIEQKKHLKTLSEAYEKRNLDFFSHIKNEDFGTETEKINNFNQFDINSIPVKTEKILKIYKSDEEEVIVIMDNKILERNSCDIYFHGTVEEIEGYLYVHIYIRSKYCDKDLYSWEYGGTSDQILEQLKNEIPDIKLVLYGREFSELTVSVQPDSSEIYLDNEYIGTGALYYHLINPGNHTLKLTNSYTNEKTIEFTSKNNEEVSFSEVLEITDNSTSFLQTVPNGANIYLKGVWKGITPLVMKNHEIGTHVLFSLDGYQETIITDKKKYSKPVILKKEEPDLQFKSEREYFYNSLAFFTMSAIYTFFSYTFYSEYDNIYYSNTLTPAENERLWNKRQFFLFSFITGLVIDVLLFADMSENIINYMHR